MLPNKPVVLCFADYFTPGFQAGGTIRAIEGIVRGLSDEFTFKIVTRNHDFGNTAEYQGVTTGSWHHREDCEVMYTSPALRTVSELCKLIRTVDPDVIYLNSLFSPDFTVKPLTLSRMGLVPPAPVLLAPRGECFNAALSQKGHRKGLFLSVARLIGLYHGVTWQASSEMESEQVRSLFGPEAPLGIAPDLLPISEASTTPRYRTKRTGELRTIFVGRIAPIKNLTFALECMRGVRGKVEFDLFGLIEDQQYWWECERIIATFGANVTVTHRGAISNHELISHFAEYDLLFMPSRSENFGFAILESLQAGCPVLISDRTPWSDLIQSNAGWNLKLEDPEAFRAIVQSCVDAGEPEFRRFRVGARHYAANSVNGSASEYQTRMLFRRVIAKGRLANESSRLEPERPPLGVSTAARKEKYERSEFGDR